MLLRDEFLPEGHVHEIIGSVIIFKQEVVQDVAAKRLASPVHWVAVVYSITVKGDSPCYLVELWIVALVFITSPPFLEQYTMILPCNAYILPWIEEIETQHHLIMMNLMIDKW